MRRIVAISLCGLLSVGVASAVTLVTQDASAQASKKSKNSKKPAVAKAPKGPATVASRAGVVLQPAGITWGMTHTQVIKFYERIIDKDFAPQYKKVQPGPQTERLDAAVANAKDAFRRSKIVFGKLPTGVDSTPLKGEYSYQNGESMMKISRRGTGTRYMFFMKDKLWKIYDEVPVGEKRPLGPDFEEALKRLNSRYAATGRSTEPDYAIGRNYTEVDWQDDRTHVRAVDRTGTKVIGMVYEDRSVLANLDSLRSVKPVEGNQVDPDVQALMRPIVQQPIPEPKEDPKGKKKGKK